MAREEAAMRAAAAAEEYTQAWMAIEALEQDVGETLRRAAAGTGRGEGT